MSASPTIRLATNKDIPAMLEIYAPYVINTAISFEKEVPSLEEFRQRVDQVLQEAPWMVYEINDTIVGYAYASTHRGRSAYRWNREVSAYVSETHQRKGVGRALYKEMFEILKKQGYLNLLAGITLPNPSSIAFHESMGFTPVGVYHGVGFKFGKIIDTGWWEMKIQDEGFRPGVILPLEQATS